MVKMLSHLLATDFVRLGRSCGTISVNTQARRFGPLLYLINRIALGNGLEAALTSSQQEEIKALSHNMRNSGVTSGALADSRSSIVHYLDLAKEIRLVAKQGSLYSLTAFGRLLADMDESDPVCPYPLGCEVRRALLMLLLSVDFIGLRTLADLLVQSSPSLADAQSEYYAHLLEALSRIAKTARAERHRRHARDRMIALKNWRNPAKYCEHLVAARANWFADLGLIDLDDRGGRVMICPRGEGGKWLRLLASSNVPDPETVVRLVLRYGEGQFAEHGLKGPKDGLPIGGICECLSALYGTSAAATGLQKTRSDVVAVHLISTGLGVLKSASDDSLAQLAEANTLNCGTWRYSLQASSRSTQSYLIRNQVAEQ